MKLGNTAKRILVSVVSIPIILAACYTGKIFFFILVLGIALPSFYEFHFLANAKNAKVNLIIGEIIIFLLLLNNIIHYINYFDFFIGVVFIISLIELFRNDGSAILNIGATFLGIFYIGLFSASILGIREFYTANQALYYRGGYLIISILGSIWICDSAAFFGGTALGKHKIFPRISPKKSWEGSIFGFIFAILSMILAHLFLLTFLPLSEIIIIGIIIGVIGQFGDFVESLFKRDAGFKDSSGLIPGHGGVFDRFDSLLFSAPVILLTLKYFAR